jgi:DNA-binding winged helix-turn-helix (wHTH) protein
VIYRFGPYQLDTDRLELRRSGVPVRVEPQVFDVLAHLVTHRDRLVTREELLDEVWGDRFVGESVLTSRLKAARRAVGDDGSEQRVIRTSHGRGYRFVAPVDRDTPAAAVRVTLAPEPVTQPAAAAPGSDGPDADPSAGDRAGEPPVGVGGPSAWPLVGRATELALLAEVVVDRSCGGVHSGRRRGAGGPGYGPPRGTGPAAGRPDPPPAGGRGRGRTRR